MVKITKVYTRSGDSGTTGLVGGKRLPKDHPRIMAYGTVDELNSVLGIVLSFLLQKEESTRRKKLAVIWRQFSKNFSTWDHNWRLFQEMSMMGKFI